MEAKIDELLKDMQQVKGDLETLRQIKPILGKLVNLPERIDNIEDEMQTVTDEVRDCRADIEVLYEKHDTSEQYNRINNLIIDGIPENKSGKENVRRLVIELASKLNIELCDQEIETAHRLPAKADRVPAIIARLNNRDKKVDLIKEAKKQELDTSFLLGAQAGPATPIYLSDHLIPINQYLWAQAKKLIRMNAVKFIWLSNCTVKVRILEKGPVTILRTEAQLNKLRRKLGLPEVTRKLYRDQEGNEVATQNGQPSSSVSQDAETAQKVNKRSAGEALSPNERYQQRTKDRPTGSYNGRRGATARGAMNNSFVRAT